MKRIILVFFALLLLCGCSAKNYTPVIKADFNLSAVYKTGDFSYSCNIIKKDGCVFVIPSSTRAKGLIISCNGKEVSFKRKDFIKKYPIEEIDKTNPAVILYQVFTSIENAKVNLADDEFTYTGNCSIGKYILVQRKDNSFSSLTFPEADISVHFNKSAE